MNWRDRVKEFRRVPASQLKANPKNWREHPPEQQRAMRGVLEEIGIAGALLARETPDGLELIDGHLRTEMADDTEWPVLVLDVDENEADVLLASVDPIGALAKTNADQLASLLGQIETENADLDSLLNELKESLPTIVEEDERDADDVPDVEAVERRCSAGDVWKLGHHRLICGDCRQAVWVNELMQGEEINVAITSPPYASQRKYDEESDFKPIPPDEFVEWFDEVQKQVAAHLAVDGSWFVNIKEHCEDGQRVLYVKDLTLAHVRIWGWRFVDEYAWTHEGTPKNVNRRFKNGWEPIFQFTKGPHKFRPDAVMHATDDVPDWSGLHPNDEDIQRYGTTKGMARKGVDASKAATNGMAYPSNVLSLGKNREALGHAAAYPTSLPEFFIRAYSDEGDIVFDPFMGSGTTLIAAEKTNRRGFGCEISPKHCDIIIARWEAFTGGKAERA